MVEERKNKNSQEPMPGADGGLVHQHSQKDESTQFTSDSHHNHSMTQMSGAQDHGNHGGHDGRGAAHMDHTGHEQMFRRKFWISLILSIPVLLYSRGLQRILGFSLPPFRAAAGLHRLLQSSFSSMEACRF